MSRNFPPSVKILEVLWFQVLFQKFNFFVLFCFLKFRVDFCALNIFSVNFCVWYKLGVQLHPFACVCPVFLTPFIEKTYLVSIVYSCHKMIDLI